MVLTWLRTLGWAKTKTDLRSDYMISRYGMSVGHEKIKQALIFYSLLLSSLLFFFYFSLLAFIPFYLFFTLLFSLLFSFFSILFSYHMEVLLKIAFHYNATDVIFVSFFRLWQRVQVVQRACISLKITWLETFFFKGKKFENCCS